MHQIHHATEQARKGVISLRGIERGLWRRAAEAERQRTEQKDRQNEPGEEIGHELDLEARGAESRADAILVMATKMPCVNIFLRPECLQGWDGAVEAAAGLEEAMNGSQESDIVINVLDDIKGTCGRQTPLREAGILQRRMDDARNTASRGIACAIPGLDEHGLNTRVLQREADEAIPTTDVIHLATRRELREQRENAFIAMCEPVAAFFDLKAGIVSIFRIADV